MHSDRGCHLYFCYGAWCQSEQQGSPSPGEDLIPIGRRNEEGQIRANAKHWSSVSPRGA